MIIYLDTSAVVPLLIREPSTPLCQEIWSACDDAVTSRLTYVETAAALAQALRARRMTVTQHGASLELLEAFWAQCNILDLDQPLATVAGSLARDHELRGHDAVHCASAAHLAEDDLVAVSGDRRLLTAWSQLGLQTYDTNGASLT